MLSLMRLQIWRELAQHKTRTVLAVLSIAVGVFALGLALGALETMQVRLEQDQRSSRPADLTFRGAPTDQATFEQDLVEAVQRRAGVADAEGETSLPIRWKLDGEPHWRNGILIAQAEYEARRISRVELMQGAWPARHTLAIERKTWQYFNIPSGESILIQTGSAQQRAPITGVVRKPYVMQPQFGGDATFYATPETLAWLTGVQGFNQLRIRLEAATDKKQLGDWLERIGLTLAGVGATGTVGEFDIPGMQQNLQAMFLILIVMGALALGASGLLIANTMNALMLQQVWQIGLLKALGATTGQVVRLYLSEALIYGALALLLAIPPATLGAGWMTVWILDLAANIAIRDVLHLSPITLVVQVGVALVVPLLAAFVPVINGARISPRQALSACGPASSSPRRLGGRDWPVPLFILNLRSAFRHAGRTMLTLTALTFVGVLFIMVMSVRESLDRSVAAVLDSFRYDVMVVFARPYHIARLTNTTAAISGVSAVEVWERRNARLKHGAQDVPVGIYGIPPDSTMFNAHIVAGRGLRAEDENAILFNRNLAADHGIAVGNEIKLVIAGQETAWRVVGLILNATVGQNDNFVPFDALAHAMGTRASARDQGGLLMLASDRHDAARQEQLINALSEVYTAGNMETLAFQSAYRFREQSRLMFEALTLMLLTMVFVAALVGSVGLTGALAIGLLERRREIGVLRAIGATRPMIFCMCVSEGLIIGGLSWLLAAPLGYPAARALSDALGQALFGTPLDFSYSTTGAIIWLTIVLTLAALASAWPAWQASRISVRDALTYE